MEELAAHCGLSLRQFERRFKRRMGLAPKVFARLLRFEAARDALLQGQEADAIRFGYQDQAHLIREFSFWSGMTPGAFVERARQRAAQTQRPQRQHTFIALFLV
jgi:AraC-like DNA-binding protein